MSGTQSCSSSSASSPHRFSPGKHACFANANSSGEAAKASGSADKERHQKSEAWWSIDRSAGQQANADSPHVNESRHRLSLRRLSEYDSIHDKRENTSPLHGHRNRNAGCGSEDVVRFHSSSTRPGDTLLQSELSEVRHAFRGEKAIPTATAVENSVFSVSESPMISAIAASPLEPSLIPSFNVSVTNALAVEGSYTALTHQGPDTDITAARRGRRSHTPPTATLTPQAATTPAAPSSSSERSPTPPRRSSRLRTASRLRLTPLGPPAIATQPRATTPLESEESGQTLSRHSAVDSVLRVTVQPSVATTHVYHGFSSSSRERNMDSVFSAPEEEERRSGVSREASTPPFKDSGSAVTKTVAGGGAPGSAGGGGAEGSARSAVDAASTPSVRVTSSPSSASPSVVVHSDSVLMSAYADGVSASVSQIDHAWASSTQRSPVSPPPLPPTPTQLEPAVSHPCQPLQQQPTVLDKAGDISNIALPAAAQSTCEELEQYHLQPGCVPDIFTPLHGFAASSAQRVADGSNEDAQPPPRPPPPPPLPQQISLESYIQHMKSPTSASCSFSWRLLLIGVGFCAIPFCCSVLLLGLHYWAVELQERSYRERAARPHVAAMLTTDFTLMLGVLLCAVVMGLGGGLLGVYVLLYRQAIRLQRRAFALCVDVCRPCSIDAVHRVGSGGGSDAHLLLSELFHGADETVSGTGNMPHRAMVSDADLLPWQTTQRRHPEVFAFAQALLAPLDASTELFPCVPSPHPRGVTGHADQPILRGSATGNVDAALHGGSVVIPHSFAGLSNNTSLASQHPNGGISAVRNGGVANVVLSRRPAHPVDGSRLQEVVTVVVCRFVVPPPLHVAQHPIPKKQLLALEALSLDFHTRLRRALRGHQAYLTDCGVSEVVFSLNTVLPVPLLVATSTAIALALAVQKELAEWCPMHRGRPVQWGVAVHRFGAVLRPARSRNGRLSLSFGSIEYGVVRRLAQLAALCNYGVLCHADFFADAMSEAKGLPVDYVMDRTQRHFLVYQLQAQSVAESDKMHMADALTLMRNGHYAAAVQLLTEWEGRVVGDGARGGELPAAAAHLLYVAHFINEAIRSSLRDGDLSAARVPGFSEWSAQTLAQSYCRPPPVWEEDTEAAFAALCLDNSFTLQSTEVGGGGGGRPQVTQTEDPPARDVNSAAVAAAAFSAVPAGQPLPPPLHASTSDSTPRVGSLATSLLHRMLPGFHGSSSSTPSLPRDHPNNTPRQQQQPPQLRWSWLRSPSPGGSTPVGGTGAGARAVRSPLSFDASVGLESSVLSPVLPCATAPPTPPFNSHTGAAPFRPPSILHSLGTFAPVMLPQAIRDAERNAAGAAAGDHVIGYRNVSHLCEAREDEQQQQQQHRHVPCSNPLSPTMDSVMRETATAPAVQLPEVRRAQRSPATSVAVPLPRRASACVTLDEAEVDAVAEPPSTSVGRRSATSRHLRSRNSSDSHASRSHGRSCSFLFDDDNEVSASMQDRNTVAAATAMALLRAPHLLSFPSTAKATNEGVSHVSLSTLSTPSLMLSGCTTRRIAPFLTKMPLFSDSTITLPGVDDDDDISSNSSSSVSGSRSRSSKAHKEAGTRRTDSISDGASFAEVSHERSMTSVVQRSRSVMSVRAAANFAAAVECTRTRCISVDRDGITRVFQGFHPNGYLVAVKQVEKSSPKALQLLRNEIHLLQRLSHPNIVHFDGEWEDDTALFMVMEYACDTLASVLRKFDRLLPGVVRHYVRGVLRALAYLHDARGVVHRDVSPNNIVITNTSDNSQAKLIDFGRSMMLPRSRSPAAPTALTAMGSAQTMHHGSADGRSARGSGEALAPIYASVVGTPMFMSPQACRGLVHPANDLWSVGIIMHLCLTGEYPYPSEALVDPDSFIDNVGSGRLVPTLAAALDAGSTERSFIEECLRLDHTQRPSAAMMLNHPFLIL